MAKGCPDIPKRFNKLTDAIKFVDSCKNSIEQPQSYFPIFSEHCFSSNSAITDGSAQNTYFRFLVFSSYQQCWQIYTRLRPSQRHWFEVIREHLPVKLFFDIDMDRRANASVDGQSVVNVLIRFVGWFAVCCFGFNEILACFDPKQVIHFDSSNEKKFSRHLIFHRLLFTDIQCLARFISELNNSLNAILDGANPLSIVDRMKTIFTSDYSQQKVSSIETDMPSLDELQQLRIRKSDGIGWTTVFDSAVYTKNRNFRIIWSSKVDQPDRVLRQVSPNGPVPTENVFTLFMMSLVSSFSASRPNDDDDHNNDENHFYMLRVRDDAPSLSKRSANRSRPIVIKPIVIKPIATSNVSSSLPSNQLTTSSPYPYLDAFIENSCKDSTSSGCIRKWTLNGDRSSITYDIHGYRFCGNVGRHHRSNSIFIVVNLQTATYFQKCFDPDCWRFRSDDFPLPPLVAGRLSIDLDLNSSLDILSDVFC